MVTVINPPAEITEEDPTALYYEPTVQDRIQRVLYRLDSGERLIDGTLNREGNFCVLGLFADEYPGRTWIKDDENVVDPVDGKTIYKCVDDDWNATSFELTDNIVKYYGFRDVYGAFRLSDISDDVLRSELESLLPSQFVVSLDKLNDLLVFGFGYASKWNPNAILAGVIRSGVVFKEETN